MVALTKNTRPAGSGRVLSKEWSRPGFQRCDGFFLVEGHDQDEWYKAAFYKGGSTNAGYWKFATQSDTAPSNAIGSLENQANWRLFLAGPLSVTQTTPAQTNQNYLTKVGAYTASESAYGTFDRNGNIIEWNDLTATSGTNREVRGGWWNATEGFSSSNSD